MSKGNRCLKDSENKRFILDGDNCTLCHAVGLEDECAHCIIHFATGKSCVREWVASYENPATMLELLKKVRQVATEKLAVLEETEEVKMSKRNETVLVNRGAVMTNVGLPAAFDWKPTTTPGTLAHFKECVNNVLRVLYEPNHSAPAKPRHSKVD